MGAVLVQSTAWSNTAKALESMRRAKALDIGVLAKLSEGEIGELVRSSGFYTVKACRVKALVEHVVERHDGDLNKMLDEDIAILRRELLGIHGIGEETADCILLYAAGKPSFVVDEYTRRIVGRLEVGEAALKTYGDYQKLFEKALPPDAEVFGEYHALLIALGKDVCRKKPRCAPCPLKDMCEYGLRNGQPVAFPKV